jgi:hypothetical protein
MIMNGISVGISIVRLAHVIFVTSSIRMLSQIVSIIF